MRLASRQSQRGAAMTEALAVVCLFVLLWCGLMFVFQLYLRKTDARGDARAAVWSHALGSCEGNAATTSAGEGADLGEVLADDAAGADTGIPAEGDSLIDEAGQVDELELGEDWGVATATAERDGVSVLKFSSDKLTSTMRVQCDEKPRGADPLSVLGFLWDLRNTVNFQ
jgi:hypothetical protein